MKCPACLLCLAMLCSQVGCATKPGPPKEPPRAGRHIVTTPSAAFYKNGPAQATGPDFALPKGKRITVVKREFGFSQVVTDEGQLGFMSNEDIAPAPPEPVQPSDLQAASTAAASKSKPTKRSGAERDYLPPPEEPPLPQGPLPKFRY